MHNTRVQRLLRYGILAAILILVTVLGRLHSIIKLFPAVDAFCPFGGLESLYVFIRYDAFLKRIALSSFILFGAVLVIALVFRRSFCGNICPLGFLQELAGTIGRKILGKRYSLPLRADRVLRFLKFLILAAVLGGTWLTSSLIFRPMDPWAAYHHLGSDELFSGYLIGFIILVLSLAGSFFSDRIFCKYICPMGAFLVPVSKIGAYSIRNNRDACTDCGQCDRACPMNIEISTAAKVTSGECIGCMECTSVCPEGALTVAAGKNGTRPLKPVLYIALTALIFALILGVTTFTKDFVWKTPTGLSQATERLLWGPQRLKGDNTFEDVVMIFRIHPDHIAQTWGLEVDDFTRGFSELDIAPQEVRTFVEGIYDEAGLNPRRLFAGGSCGGH